MDGYGALAMLIKRQNADKYRKAEFRYELQKRRENFLTNEMIETEFNFPELSKDEIGSLKANIQNQMKKEKVKNNLTSAFLFTTVCLFVAWLISIYSV